MRELKFRAWDGSKMLSAENGDLSPIGDSENAMPDEIIHLTKSIHDWIWMQYTGLKDKNGVEVYEGDIVRWVSTHSGALKVKSVDTVVWDTEYSSYFLIPAIHELWASDMEVIGNIYENPELLNEK